MELHTYPLSASADIAEQPSGLQQGGSVANGTLDSQEREVDPWGGEMQLANLGDHFRAFSLRDMSGGLAPFLGVDHVWMSAPTFPPHSHQGIAVVSYLFQDSETGMANQDSIGNDNTIRPGGLHWTTTGRGIVHEEVPAEEGKAVHSLQIFLSLPANKRNAPPASFMLEPERIPTLERPGVSIRVPLGQLEGAASPEMPATPIDMLDIKLDAGSEVVVPVAANSMAFVLPISGSVSVNGRTFERSDLTLPVFAPRNTSGVVTLRAGQEKAWAVFFAGSPQHVYGQEE